RPKEGWQEAWEGRRHPGGRACRFLKGIGEALACDQRPGHVHVFRTQVVVHVEIGVGTKRWKIAVVRAVRDGEGKIGVEGTAHQEKAQEESRQERHGWPLGWNTGLLHYPPHHLWRPWDCAESLL